MRRRLLLSFALLLLAMHALSEAKEKMEALKAIGAGPFEFPIAGEFSIERDGGATVFATANDERRITVAFFRNASAASQEQELIERVAGLMRRNWERFAKEEKGSVTSPFRRINLPSGLVVFTMSTEFTINGKVQHYVQYAVTDGPQVGTLSFEGFGSAKKVASEVEPLVLLVRRVSGSN